MMKKNGNNAIKNWAADERPREKLLLHGAQVLSDAELIAIIFGNGTKEKSAVDIGRELLVSAGNDWDTLARFSPKEMQRINGVGPAKAISLAACLEIAKRRAKAMPQQEAAITSSRSAFHILLPDMQDLNQEIFVVLYLNRRNKVLHKEIISKGGMSGTVVDVRIVIKTALDHRASGLIIAHNHPSKSLQPSEEDKRLTKIIRQAADLFSIKLLDHIIIAGQVYYSFSDEGLL